MWITQGRAYSGRMECEQAARERQNFISYNTEHKENMASLVGWQATWYIRMEVNLEHVKLH